MLLDFSYNYGYQESLSISMFEALYGQSCNTTIILSNLVNRVLRGPNMMVEMEQEMLVIKKNMKVAQDIYKIYADKNRMFKDF